MKKRTGLILSFVLLICMIPFAALAENSANGNSAAANPGATSSKVSPAGVKPGVNPNPGMLNPLAQLDLTPDQQKKIAEIEQNFRTESKPIFIEMQKKQMQLQQLWNESSLNQAAIEAKDKELIVLRIQFVTKSRNMIQQINGVLTPAQREKLKNNLKNPTLGKTGN